MKFGRISMLFALGLLALAPLSKASEWDKRTIVTFGQPVEIPGHVLPAGTYVMRLLDNPGNRNIVQFFNKDETQLLGTALAVSDMRTEPASKTVITFEERRGDAPQAIHEWFYPGDLDGSEFLYPPATMQ